MIEDFLSFYLSPSVIDINLANVSFKYSLWSQIKKIIKSDLHHFLLDFDQFLLNKIN